MANFSVSAPLQPKFLCLAIVALLFAAPCNQLQDKSSAPARDFLPEMRSNFKIATILAANQAWIISLKSGDLLRTVDGGQHWFKISGAVVGGEFLAAFFQTDSEGWAVGAKGTVWQSTDRGDSWTQISQLTPTDPNAWVFIGAEKIQFTDGVGWILETFGLWRSNDRGMTWQRVQMLNDKRYRAQPDEAMFLTANDVVVGFSNGNTQATSDGGKSWKGSEVLNGSIIQVGFLDQGFGWLLGYGPPTYQNRIFLTKDGGSVWSALGEIPHKSSIYFVQFLDQTKGWAVGVIPASYDAQSQPRGIVLRTDTAGKTWEQSAAPNEHFFEHVHFTDPSNGWLLGRDSLYRTSDGGLTWTMVLKKD